MYTGICGGEIKKMTLARSQAGVHSSSDVDIIESRKDLYQAVVTGRTVYGSSRSGESRVDSVYQLMVCIGPDVSGLSWTPCRAPSACTLHKCYQRFPWFSFHSRLRLLQGPLL